MVYFIAIVHLTWAALRSKNFSHEHEISTAHANLNAEKRRFLLSGSQLLYLHTNTC